MEKTFSQNLLDRVLEQIANEAATSNPSLTRRQDSLVQEFGLSGWYPRGNDKTLASRGLLALDVKAPGFKPLTRADGSKYYDWGRIVPDKDLTVTASVMQKNPSAAKDTITEFISRLKQKGAKPNGMVSGEFGSSEKHPVYRLGDVVYVDRGTYIEYGTMSKLKNSSVWRP